MHGALLCDCGKNSGIVFLVVCSLIHALILCFSFVHCARLLSLLSSGDGDVACQLDRAIYSMMLLVVFS